MITESRWQLARLWFAPAVAMFLVGVAPAAEAEGDKYEQMRRDIHKRLDTDGDGKISEEETEAAAARYQVERFDKDGDGVLNGEEQAAADKRRQERIAKFDSDGDGKLSREERKAMHKSRRGSALDLDGNGTITPGERATARANREKQHEEMVEKYDEDGDGQLSRAESAVAIEAGEHIGRGVIPLEERKKKQ